jgi:hypothetical protein
MKEFTKFILIITLLFFLKVSGVSQICYRSNELNLSNSICLLNQTTAGEKSDINQYACSLVAHNSPEKIYSFYVQEACNIQIGLEILNGVDLDLFLFKYSCGAALREHSSEIINCIASSGSSNTSSNKEAIQILLQPGLYFLAVDANSASTIGNFNLDITCGDLNCTTATAISCNIPINGTTVGSVNNSSIYSFNNSASRDVNNSGPEKIYSFTLNSVSNIDILLNNFSSNLDLFLISDCKTKVFLSKSDNTGNGVAERINVTNLSAGKYFIVVDGYRCSSGSFTLQVNSNTCSNEDCSNIEKTFNTGTNSYRLRLNRSGASNFVWSVLQTGQISNQSLIDIPVRSTNVNITVNLSYILNGITYNCTKNICVKSPLTCQEISYKIIDNNCVKYELSSSNASDITWVDNSTGIIFGRNRLSDCLSIPSCANKNITVNYVLDGIEYTCINQAYICPPAEKCENIDYVYDKNNGCYRFNLNFPGIVPSNISWINDNTGGTLGSAIQSNCLYVPISSNCSDYQITVNFSANGKRYSCTKKFNLCNRPNDCTDISTFYDNINNCFSLSLALQGATNIEWRNETSNSVIIGTGSNLNCYRPSTCDNQTITVKYAIGSNWYVCSSVISFCNPFNSSTINFNGFCNQNSVIYEFSIPQNFRVNRWYFDNSTLISTDNKIQVPDFSRSANYICVNYTDANNKIQTSCSYVVPSNWIKCATGDNHTLIIPNNLSVNPANLFEVGDIIGVFYKNGSSLASGGIVQYNRLNTAVAIQGDDASSSVKDGFSNNEAFILQRFSSKFGTIHNINGDYEPINGFSITAQGNYQNRGISKLKAINTGSTGCLPFDKGWNLISSYIIPTNTAFRDLLANSASSIELIKDDNGLAIYPNLNIYNTMPAWDFKKAYKLKASNSGCFTFTGTKVDRTVNAITLRNNWQYFPVWYENPTSISSVLNKYAQNIIIVKDIYGNIFIPGNIDNIGNLTPFKGYELKSNGSITINNLNNDESYFLQNKNSSDALEYYKLPSNLNTGSNANILFLQDKIKSLFSIGDEMAVLDKQNNIFGAIKYNGENLSLVVWGDDPATTTKDGFKDNETMIFKLWEKRTNRVYEFKLNFTNGLTNMYKTDNVYYVDQIILATVPNNEISNDSNITISPNPVSDILFLEFNSDVKSGFYSIFSNLGNEMFKGEFDKSSNNINVSNLVDGIYYIRINSQQGNIVHKFIKTGY